MSDKKVYLFSARREGEPEPTTPRERVVIEVPSDPTIQPFNFDDNDSPELFPKKDDVRERGMMAGIMPFLKLDQKDVVEEYTALYQKCLNGTSPDQGPRLIDGMFIFMTEQMKLVLGTDWKRMGPDYFDGLVKGGMIDMYYDIITRDGFLLEHTPVVETIFQCMGECVMHARENDFAADAILRRGPQLWEYIWTNRAQLRTRAKHELIVISLAVSYHSLHQRRTETQVQPTTFLPQVALYLWVDSEIRSVMTGSLLRALIFMNKHQGNLRDTIPDREEFVQQAILDASGPNAFLARCRSELEATPHAKLGGDFFRLIGTVVQITCSPLMVPHMGDFEPLHHLTTAIHKAIKQNTISDVRSVEEAFVAVHLYLSLYTMDFLREIVHEESCTMMIRGEDVIRILARGIDIALTTKDPTLVTDIRNTSLNEVRDYGVTAINIQNGVCRNSSAPALLAGLRAGAREEWWPSLRRLQDAHYRAGSGSSAKGHATMLRAWADFGGLLGLDEEKEKMRHEKEARARCAWRECVYYETPAPHDLKACAGCSEVRYCGRECQKSDWSRGGHKKRCKRLK